MTTYLTSIFGPTVAIIIEIVLILIAINVLLKILLIIAATIVKYKERKLLNEFKEESRKLKKEE